MAVPNTNTFSLQDVVDEINPTTDDLVDCISDANNAGYDTNYYTAPATSLLEFRNYSSDGFNQNLISNGFTEGIFNNFARDLAIQPDGKVLIVGPFRSFNGHGINQLIRLNSNGTEDLDFSTAIGNAFDGDTRTVELQPDGKILVGGEFSEFKGNNTRGIVRLNSDGTEDLTFTNNLGIGFSNSDDIIFSIKVQPNDNKILVGGKFTSFNGVTTNYLIRLESDGQADTTFNSAIGTNILGNWIRHIAVQSDGKILIGGHVVYISMFNSGVVRLNSDGTEDLAFTNNLGTGFNSPSIYRFEIQPNDGKIVVVGFFNSFNGNNLQSIVRLNSDGTEDLDFSDNLNSAGQNIESVAIQPDGKIVLVGGMSNFENIYGLEGVVRLNSDGTVDTNFTNNLVHQSNTLYVYNVRLQSDGKIIIVGSFSSFMEYNIQAIIRINSDGTINV
jgi:uncharacterized delta-60 repeat protein